MHKHISVHSPVTILPSVHPDSLHPLGTFLVVFWCVRVASTKTRTFNSDDYGEQQIHYLYIGSGIHQQPQTTSSLRKPQLNSEELNRQN